MGWPAPRLRVLDAPLRAQRCRQCGVAICWATREGGTMLPIVPDAFTYATETTPRGVRYRVIGGDSVHACRRRAVHRVTRRRGA